MEAGKKIRHDFTKNIIWTFVLTTLFLFFCWGKTASADLIIALPFFVILYFVVFSIGKETFIAKSQKWISKKPANGFVFPLVLLLTYVIYLLINKQNPLEGNPLVGLYLVFLPVIAFTFRGETSPKIGWFDFTIFALILLPGALLNIDQSSEMPITGGGFDSFFHVLIILTGIYSFAVIRRISEVGFVPELKWKSFATAVMVWLAFYLLVLAIGMPIGFIEFVGYQDSLNVIISSVVFTMIGTFLHTALFEELFFRGILQNMLARRIGQAKSWKIFWATGFVLLLICAFLVGYTLEGKMKWFPALITVLIFAAAYFIENSRKFETGIYTSLAITAVTFGLVHYHAKSIIYIGLACVAGWAYGYTYIKTKNVFYSAMVHMLVNTSVLIFGLKMIR